MGGTLDEYIIQQLKEGGATTSDIILVKKRIHELVNLLGDRANIDRHILSCINDEFGITTPQIEAYQKYEELKALSWFGESISRKERSGG